MNALENSNLNSINENETLNKLLNESLNDISETFDYETPRQLNDTWVIWIYKEHNSNKKIPQNQSENLWKSNIKNVYEFNTIQEFWKYYNHLTYINVPTIFLMRKGINPVWEDPLNKSGGAWSFITSKPLGIDTWIDISCMAVGETLAKQHFNNYGKYLINGISISIKLKSFVIKIWGSDKTLNDSMLINDIKNVNNSNISYKNYFGEISKPVETKFKIKGNWE